MDKEKYEGECIPKVNGVNLLIDEDELQELLDYNLEYMDALQSEEIFGGDYTSAIDLKYADRQNEKLKERIKERIKNKTTNTAVAFVRTLAE